MTMKPSDYFDIPKLKEMIDAAATELNQDYLGEGIYIGDTTGNEDLSYYMVEELVSGSEGIYKANELVEMFGIRGAKWYRCQDSDAYESDIWIELIDPFFYDLSIALEERLHLPEGHHLFFGHNENDGSYGLFLSVCFERNEP